MCVIVVLIPTIYADVVCINSEGNISLESSCHIVHKKTILPEKQVSCCHCCHSNSREVARNFVGNSVDYAVLSSLSSCDDYNLLKELRQSSNFVIVWLADASIFSCFFVNVWIVRDVISPCNIDIFTDPPHLNIVKTSVFRL